MKKKLGVVISFIMLAVCSVFFAPATNKQKVHAADSSTQYECKYLYDGTSVYLSNNVAGKASGYGKFAKGEKVGLTATALDGFELVGWRIVYENNESSMQFVEVSGTTSTYKNTDAEYDSKYKMVYNLTFGDNLNNDCKNDFGTFTIETAKVDMTISPVFDYIYYNVVIGDSDIVDLQNKTEISAGKYLYYTTPETFVDGVYQDAVIQIGETYNYYGTLYFDGSKYYTIHDKNEDAQTKQVEIDYSKGAFRLGETVDLNLKYKQLVDVRGACFTNLTRSKTLTRTNEELALGKYSLQINSTNKNTESISAKYVMDKSCISALETSFKVTYDNLYVVSFDFKIDGKSLDENYLADSFDLKSLLVENVETNSYFSKYNNKDDEYLIKSNGTSVKCEKVIKDASNKFSYYKFEGITGYGDNPILLNNIGENKTLTINYSSVEYNIIFNYILEDGTILDESKFFTLPQTTKDFTLLRGQKQEINSSFVHNPEGFEYVTTKVGEDLVDLKNNNYEISINDTEPKDIVVNMVYDYIDYAVSLEQAIDALTLNGSYPLLSATLHVEREGENLSSSLGYVRVANNDKIPDDFADYYEIKDNVMTKSDSITNNVFNNNKIYYTNNVYGHDFDLKIHIGDKIEITAVVTNQLAFIYRGFKFSRSGSFHTEKVEFNKGTISSFEGESLKLYTVEEFKSYDLIYKIDYKKVDNKNYLMAQIGTENNSLQKEFYSQVIANNEEDFKNGLYYEIESNQMKKSTTYDKDKIYYTSSNSSNYNLMVINGLKYKENLSINATSNFYDKDEDGNFDDDNTDESLNDYYFTFISFEKNGIQFKADSTSGTPAISNIKVAITGNDIITVKYSQPKTTLIVELNNEKVMNEGLYHVQYLNDNSQYTYFDNDNTEYYLEGGVYYAPSNAKIKIILDNSKIKVGYKHTGMTLTKLYAGGSQIPSQFENAHEYEFELDDCQHIVTLNFSLVEYRATVLQNGAGLTDEPYDFDGDANGIQPLSLHIENLKTIITIPTYYYVSEVKVQGSVFPELCQKNEDVQYDYSLDFSDNIDLFEQSVKDLTENAEGYIAITITIQYTLHTTNIDIYYGLDELDSSQSRQYKIFDLFPDLTGSDASIAKEFITNDRAQRIGVRFLQVPFGSTFGVNINSLIEGLEFKDGTTNGKTITFEAIGDEWSSDNLANGRNTIVDVDSLDLDLITYEFDINMSYVGSRTTSELKDGKLYTLDNNQAISNPEYSSATLFGGLSFFSKANIENGIKFDTMYYFSRAVVDEENFGSLYDILYVYEGGKFNINDSTDFDADKIYYNKVEVNGRDLSVMEFIPAQFGTINKEIKLFVVYKDYLFGLDFFASEEGGANSLNFDPINMLPKDYATYRVFANNNETSELKFNDDVIVEILLNEEYVLSNGVKMNNVKLDTIGAEIIDGYAYVEVDEFDETITYFKIVDGGMEEVDETIPVDGRSYFIEKQGSYIITFRVDNNVSGKVRNDKLSVYLTYKVETKEIMLITNILDSSFFDDSNGLLLKIEDHKGNVLQTDRTYSVTTNNADFLSKSKLTYEFDKNSKVQYFEIKNFNVYYYINDTDYFKIPEELYADYGIKKIDPPENEPETFIGLEIYHCVQGKLVFEFIVNPIIKINEDKDDTNPNAYVFTKEYKELNWVGQPNLLTIGQGSGFDIEAESFVQDQLEITYFKSESMIKVDTPIDQGEYIVKIDFKNDGWWKYIKYEHQIILKITQKTISIYYNHSAFDEQISKDNVLYKEYDGTSRIDAETNNKNKNKIFNNLCIIKDFNSYALASTNFSLITNNMTCTMGVTEMGEFIESIKASNRYYQVRVSGIQLAENNSFNKNYRLEANYFDTKEILKVNPKEVYIEGLKIYDKVWDGEDNAVYYLDENKYEIKGILDQDQDMEKFSIKFDLGVYKFSNADIDANKRILINLSNAIEGEMRECYKVVIPNDLTASIYPYSVSATLKGFGEVTVYNLRGRADCTNQEMVRLIPINTDALDKKPILEIREIAYESEKYFSIYRLIANNIRDKKYKTGFSLVLSANNTNIILNSNLYVGVPQAKKAQTLLYTTSNYCGELELETINGLKVFDLSKNSERMTAIVVLKDRIYLKWWQIVLIVAGVAMVVGTAITTFLVIRSKKKKSYKDEI